MHHTRLLQLLINLARQCIQRDFVLFAVHSKLIDKDQNVRHGDMYCTNCKILMLISPIGIVEL